MKKLVVIVAAIVLVACGKEEVKKDYVTFSGTIIDQDRDSIWVS